MVFMQGSTAVAALTVVVVLAGAVLAAAVVSVQ